MSIEIVAPRVSEDGITFYVSADGSQTGVSIRGLENLLGMTPSGCLFRESRYPILFRMSTTTVQLESDPKSLEPCWGNVFTPQLRGTDNAKIVSSKAAACIIKYFAIVKQNTFADASLNHFLDKGFDTWVKEVVQFSSEPTLNKQLLESLNRLSEKMEAVAAKVAKWDKIEGITATVYPGMQFINDSLSVEDISKVLPTHELFTVKEWLAMKGVVLDKSTFCSFARQAADTYKTMTGERPPFKYTTSPKTGKAVKDGNGYRVVDFTILASAWETFNK